jgi:hypothetical protein
MRHFFPGEKRLELPSRQTNAQAVLNPQVAGIVCVGANNHIGVHAAALRRFKQHIAYRPC